ncbi:MAG: hypothetical protein WC674_03400 [Candidatus Krumholzibacteriia bacterium]
MTTIRKEQPGDEEQIRLVNTRAFGQSVEAGIEEMRRAAQPFVIVLGHPTYYPRFGFVPASRYEITSEYEGVPDEAFIILVLDESALAGVAGTAKYRPEFAEAV